VSVFHRILVAYDGSEDSRSALELAISLALDQQATLTVLTVVPEGPANAVSVAVGPYDLSPVYAEVQETAKAAIPDDVSVSLVIRQGIPARSIVDAAEDHDLVVMGTRGRGRIGEALGGSVSRSVLHSLRGAVLLTRAPVIADEAPERTHR
jgi:nucleotide-binding universal stress UspA family protein